MVVKDLSRVGLEYLTGTKHRWKLRMEIFCFLMMRPNDFHTIYQ